MKPWRLAACAFRDCRRLLPVADSLPTGASVIPRGLGGGLGVPKCPSVTLGVRILPQSSEPLTTCGDLGPKGALGTLRSGGDTGPWFRSGQAHGHGYGPAGVRPHDRRHVRCGATEASVRASPPTAASRGGLSKSAITRKAKAGTWEPVPPRAFMASYCEPRVPSASDHAEIQRNLTARRSDKAAYSNLVLAWGWDRAGNDSRSSSRPQTPPNVNDRSRPLLNSHQYPWGMPRAAVKIGCVAACDVVVAWCLTNPAPLGAQACPSPARFSS